MLNTIVFVQTLFGVLRKYSEILNCCCLLSTDSVPVLIMCDWLATKGIDPAVVDVVTQVYQACNDAAGLKKVSSLAVESQSSGKGDTSDLLQTQIAIENHSVGLQSNTELMDTEQTSAAVVGESVTLPIREQCPICKAAIAVESLEYGACPNGHRWPRCCVSFVICAQLALRRCQDCNRCVSTPSVESSIWLRGLLQLTSKCPFCLGFFH